MKIDKNKRNLKLLSFFIVFSSALFFSVLAILLSLTIVHTDLIHNGVYVEGIDISGLSSMEAVTKIEKSLAESTQDNKLKLRYGDKMWSFSSKDIGIKYDFRKAISEASDIGRKGNYINRIIAIIRLLNEPQIISIKSQVDFDVINSILDSIATEIYSPSIEATMERKNGEFIIHEGYVGISLDKEKTYSNIIQQLNDSRYNESIEVNLSLNTKSPKFTSEMLSQIQNLLGSYSTKFNSNVKGRTNNIYLSSKAINGTIMLPGEVFSFNNVVGPRNISNGYKEAPVIIKGDLVDGLGGGVCQVSSTIYNTVLRSGLDIVERVNHSIPSTYVPKGLDATVSYGALDFKFKNTTDYPIFIESFVKGNQLSINIYGYKTTDKEIKIFSQIDEVINMDVKVVFDSSILKGKEIVREKGRNGYRTTSYMVIYENGVELDKKIISRDYYAPNKRIIIRGTKEPPPEPVEEDNKSDDEDMEKDKIEETEE